MSISPLLLRAYRQTTYCAAGMPVRIGRHSPALDGWLRQRDGHGAVFVTAWNPFSRPMPDAWNRRMQQHLMQRLRRRTLLPARAGTGRWQEEHLLVVAPLPWVAQVARRFRQNAVVAIRRGGVARLHLLVPAAPEESGRDY